MKNIFRFNGFTLTELLVTIALMAILAVVAVNIFSQQARKGRRIDGINVILTISLSEERYRSNNSTYGTLAQVWGGTTSPEGYYTLTVSGNTATAYTITATAAGDQVNDKENSTSCTPLVMSVSNGAITKTPAGCWPT